MATKIIGIDASTNSIAFCLMDGKTPVKWGEVVFHGSTVYERLLDAKYKIKSLKERLNYDTIYIEAAVSVKSVATGLKMAYMFGTIMGELMYDDTEVVEVHPLKWQGYINNPNFTKAEKQRVKEDFPGKSETWYKNKVRELRKQRTINFAKTLGIETESDNVADAVGIAWWGANERSL